MSVCVCVCLWVEISRSEMFQYLNKISWLRHFYPGLGQNYIEANESDGKYDHQAKEAKPFNFLSACLKGSRGKKQREKQNAHQL